MNNIIRVFNSKNVTKPVIIYYMAGYPDKNSISNIAISLIKGGIRLIELGIPFSDPAADGPIIQNAGTIALKNNITLNKVFIEAKKIKNYIDSLPFNEEKPAIIMMGYYNQFMRYGIEKLVKSAKKNGISGFIIPDLPAEYDEGFYERLKAENFATINLVSEFTDKDRLYRIVNSTTGFIYLVSHAGITGSKIQNFSHLKKQIYAIKKIKDIPVCIGFGISTKENVKEALSIADGAIIGSAFISYIKEYIDKQEDLSFQIINNYLQKIL